MCIVCQDIYKGTKKRGYARGYTPKEFALRQAVKLIEEAAEAALAFELLLPDDLRDAIWEAHRLAKKHFDDGFGKGDDAYISATMIDNAIGEAADVMVVLCNLVEAGGDGKISLCERASDKNRADIARGVRGQGGV